MKDDRGAHDAQRGMQEILAKHIQQVEMYKLLQAEGGTQRRSFGEQSGERAVPIAYYNIKHYALINFKKKNVINNCYKCDFDTYDFQWD